MPVKSLIRFAFMLLIVVALMGLIGCEEGSFDGNDDDNDDNNGGNGMMSRVTVGFTYDAPEFFAYRSGAAGMWTREAVSGSSFSFDVDDNDSAFAIAGTCVYRGWRTGYIYESDTRDARELTVRCDETDATMSYEFFGEVTSFSTQVPATLGIQRKEFNVFGQYSFNVELDEDDDEPKDVVAWAFLGFPPKLHYKLQRGITLTPMVQWNVDFDPSDTGEDVEVNVGNFSSDPSYHGTSLKLHTLGGLRAEVGVNDTPNQSQYTFQKLPGSLAASSDMYKFKTSIKDMVIMLSHVRYASNPTSVDISAMPHELPEVNGVEGGATDNFVWNLQLSMSYDLGISGFTVNYASARTEGTVPSENDLPIRWILYKTSTPWSTNPSISFPRELADLNDWNDDWTPSKDDLTGFGVAGSNGSDQQALDAQVNNDPDDGLAVGTAFRFQFNF